KSSKKLPAATPAILASGRPPSRASARGIPLDRDSKHFRSSFPTAGFRTGTWRTGKPAAGERLELLHDTTLHALAAAAKLGGKAGITLYFDDEDEPAEHRTFSQIHADVKR